MRTYLFASFLFFVTACNKKTAEVVTAPANTNQKTWLALGDSYTIGQSVGVTERFPHQTASLLMQQNVQFAEPVYLAQTGWTTQNLLNAIASQNPPATYDVVSLLIGVNDQYQGLDTGGYTTRFTLLLEKAIQFAKGKPSNVFVLSIPDYSATAFVPASNKPAVRQQIDMFNAINKRITDSYGVSYTDITPSSREAESNSSLVANDGLHPSGLEYKKWAAMLAPKMKAVL
jgi:lysophospholipase L1-like esterase